MVSCNFTPISCDEFHSDVHGPVVFVVDTRSHFAAMPALAFIFTTFYVGVKVIAH